MDEEQSDADWARKAVKRLLERVFFSMSQDYALLAKLAARR
jgi:hypothetical protein